MTESTEATPAAQGAPPAEDVPTASYGRLLAAERERQGISVVDMAARLRLHPKQIAAIEAEDLDRLPGGPFVRGFVRNYAKELRIDPAPLLSALHERLAPDRTPAADAAAGPSQAVRDATRERVSRSVVIIGAVGALIAFGIIGWLSTRSAPEHRQTAEPPVQPAAAAPTSGDSQAMNAAHPPAQRVEPDAAAPVAVADQAVAAAPAQASPIRLAFRERAWVEVTQADGRVLLSQNNDAGSEQKLDGKPPFRLVIGNAAAVTLEYRGRIVDLKPLTSSENVARVTLE